MELTRAFCTALVALGAIGLLLPADSVALAAEAAQVKADQAVAHDLALAEHGRLRGQVMNGDAVGVGEAIVTIWQDKQIVARAITDRDGSFTVSGLRGGVYVVASGQSAALVRAWHVSTAPPAAANGVLLVDGELTARGQHRLHELLGGEGDLGFGNLGLGALLVLGLVGTVVGVAISRGDAS